MTQPGGGGPDTATRDATVNLQANVDPYVQGLRQAEVQTNRTGDAVDKLDAKFRSLGQSVSAGLKGVSRADFAFLGVATADAATFQKQLGTLNATAAVTGQRFSGTKGAIESAFVSLPTSRTNLVALAGAISNLGVTGSRDMGALLTVFTKLGAATGESSIELASGLIQLGRAFGQTNATQIGNMANVVLTLSKNAGTSATSVINFANSIAPLARQAGIGQDAILGISSAFSKAGADGFVAGNAFNSVVSDIIQLTKSGSPDLAKYANLVGMTIEQFKATPGQNQLMDVFSALNKQGPAAINTLQRLGVANGVRAQSALAAVSANGGLQAAIDQATAASGDQRNLNKGASAATNTLADDLAKLRNQFTEMGTAIGNAFLPPLQKGVQLVTGFISAAREAAAPLSPLIAMFMGVAGAVTAAAAAFGALSHLVGIAALAMLVFRSGPLKAFREGMSAGQAIQGETAEARLTRLGGNETLNRMNMHEAGARRFPLRARLAFQAGNAVGDLLPPVDPNGGPGIVRQAGVGAVRALGRGARFLVTSQAGLLRDATRSAYARSVYQTQGAEAGPDTTVRSRIREGLAANQAAAASSTLARSLVQNSITVGGAFKDLAVQTVRTAVNIATLGRVGGMSTAVGPGPTLRARAAGAIGATGRGAVAAGRGLVTGAASLARSIGPIQGALLGGYAAMQIKSALDRHQAATSDLTDLNPIEKYNQQLGIASTNLASFSNSLDDAARKNADSAASVTSFAQAARVTEQDKAKFSGQKGADATVNAIGKGNVHQAIELGKSYKMTDPKQLAMFKQNLLGAGFTADETQRVMDGLTNGGTAASTASPDYAVLGQSINDTENHGFHIPGTKRYASESGGKIAESALTSIDTTKNANLETHSAAYAQQVSLQQATQLLASQGHGADGEAGRAALAATISELTTGGKGEAGTIQKGLVKQLPGAPGRNDGEHAAFQRLQSETDPIKQQQAVIQLLQSTKAGAAYLKNISGTTGTTLAPEQFDSIIASMSGQESQKQITAAKAAGPLGTFATSDKTVADAIATPDSPSAQFRGMAALADAAAKAGGGLSNTAEGLDKLMGAIQDTTSPLYQLAMAAKSASATVVSQTVTPYQSRSAQLSSSAGLYQEASNANAKSNTKETGAALASAQANYASAQQAAAQYENSVYMQAIQFGTQMERAQADQNTQMAYAQADFYKSQTYAAEDYQKSRLRSTQDFGLQLSRQAQSAAQNIYDPFTRIAAKYTADAGTVVQNLENQNAAISKQFAQLGQLKGMGVSQDTINTLQLADPGNAQQTNNLVSSLTNDPALVQKINQAVSARISATTQLTQSSFSATYSNTIADFNTQMDRASADYATAQQRAVDAQALSMDRMATAYNLMVQRSAQDLTTSMTELYGSFADNYGATLGAINDKIAQYAPGIAGTLSQTLADMNKTLGDVVITVTGPGGAPVDASGGGGSRSSGGRGGPVGGGVAEAYPTAQHAMGTISTKEHVARVSEGNKPEMILPLDQRGQQYMAPFMSGISMAVVRTLAGKAYASSGTAAPGGGSTTMIDQSTQFTGDITVQAQDPNAMAKALAEKQRMRALVRPRASTAGP
jgi:TP901 family phage tail tape measure protein